MKLPLIRPSLTALVVGGLVVSPLFWTRHAHADNPIVQHTYTADPAPVVYGDTVYLYTSHDEDVTVDGFFTMNDWRVFSSQDMVNWTDHGMPLSWKTFSWAQANHSWAPHGVERDGKYYMYVPLTAGIGVAVADTPIGPFKDAAGKPLVTNYQYIDPTVFVDDDGQAYLYFGNPKLWYVKLNDDMISVDGGVQEIPQTAQSFRDRIGGPKDGRTTSYEEGPWFYKRNDIYYMVFASGPLPETISYATAPAATGPWTYKSVIMDNTSGMAFTNHSGTVDFKGHSYLFYHTQELPGGGGYKRSVAVEEFTYGGDGSIPKVMKTSGGPDAADNLNPYLRTEGETIAWTGGVEVEDCMAGGRNVTSIENNDYIKVKSVDFLTGALSFEASVASAGSGGNIELHLDTQTGQLLGTCMVASTGGAQMWDSVTCDVNTVGDVHDLFLVFKGGGGQLFNLDWWQFTPKDPLPMGSGGADGSGSGGEPSTGAGGAEASGGGLGVSSGGTSTGAGGGAAVASGGNTTSPSTGGAATNAGSGGSPGPDDEGNSSETPDGCSCTTGPGRGGSPGGWLLFGLTALGAALMQSRRRRMNSNSVNP